MPSVDYELDHIVPLWSVDRTLPWGELIRFWMLPNLQALCVPCHAEKTAAETTQRAVLRKKVSQP